MATNLGMPDKDNQDYNADVTSLIEMGARSDTALTSWSEWRNDAFLLYSKNRVSLEKLIAMRRTDGMARALATLVSLPIKLALQQGKWVSPAIGGAEEEVEFANLMWTTPPASGGMTTPAAQVIDQMLLAIFDGFSAFELVSHIPKHGPLKGKKTLRKMAYRDPRTVTLLQDARGGYAGFRQNVLLPNREILDVSLSPAKTALFTVQGHENPLYGVSYFESCYPHYEKKMRWYYMSEMAGQFAAIPGRIGTVPRTAKSSEVMAFRKALESMHFNTTLLKKEGWTVEPFNNTSGFSFMPYIDHHNLMMSKAVLASFMESEQRTVLVENSTQDASADLFLLSMETLANEFASVLTNHVMPKYIRENFKNTDRFPEFKPGPLSDNARKKIASLFERLGTSPILNTTPELVRQLEIQTARDLGLDVDYEEIEAREEEAAVQQAEQAEYMAQQAQQETLEQERAAEGGIPGTTNGASTARSFAGGDVTAQMSYDESLDNLMLAMQNMFVTQPLENHPIDEGF